MDDALNVIYVAMMDDPLIKQEAGGRIKYYEYPDTASVSEPYVVIDPLDSPMPAEYGDDTWLMNDFIVQIDVWSKDRKRTRQVSSKIQQVLWDVGFKQYGGGADEWDKETGIYREARRYRARIYRNDII